MGTLRRMWKKFMKDTGATTLFFLIFTLLVLLYAIVVPPVHTEPFHTHDESEYIKTLDDGKVILMNILLPGDGADLLFYFQEDKDYHIIINSYGGAAWDTITFMNRLAELKSKGYTITTEVYGYAMSAGACIFIMGNKRIIHKNACVMLHGAGMDNGINRKSLRKPKDLEPDVIQSLTLLDDVIKKQLLKITGLTYDKVLELMYEFDANYISASKAYKLGIATELKGGI